MVTHQQLVELAKHRLKEAKILKESGEFDGAAYLIGYAIEISLKAVITAERLVGYPEKPQDCSLAKEAWDHDLNKLLRLAEKDGLLGDTDFADSWRLVTDWKPDDRYRPIGTVTEAGSGLMVSAAESIITSLGIL